jgi:phosphatidylglycerophosphatase C
LAIFDFCDTLFDGQSVSSFIAFLESRLPFRKRIISKIRKKLNKIPSTDSKRHKEYLLKSYRGMEQEKVEKLSREFFEKIILKKLHRQVLEKLQAHKKAGDIVVIASGGFENYLKLFQEHFEVNHLFCTTLQFKNSKFTGLIEGNECLGLEKTVRVKEFFSNFDIDWRNSFVYSDNHSDLPLFDMTGNKIVVQNSQRLDWLPDRDRFVVLRIDNG